jgi:hypothetical protein
MTFFEAGKAYVWTSRPSQIKAPSEKDKNQEKPRKSISDFFKQNNDQENLPCHPQILFGRLKLKKGGEFCASTTHLDSCQDGFVEVRRNVDIGEGLCSAVCTVHTSAAGHVELKNTYDYDYHSDEFSDAPVALASLAKKKKTGFNSNRKKPEWIDKSSCRSSEKPSILRHVFTPINTVVLTLPLQLPCTRRSMQRPPCKRCWRVGQTKLNENEILSCLMLAAAKCHISRGIVAL